MKTKVFPDPPGEALPDGAVQLSGHTDAGDLSHIVDALFRAAGRVREHIQRERTGLEHHPQDRPRGQQVMAKAHRFRPAGLGGSGDSIMPEHNMPELPGDCPPYDFKREPHIVDDHVADALDPGVQMEGGRVLVLPKKRDQVQIHV